MLNAKAEIDETIVDEDTYQNVRRYVWMVHYSEMSVWGGVGGTELCACVMQLNVVC